MPEEPNLEEMSLDELRALANQQPAPEAPRLRAERRIDVLVIGQQIFLLVRKVRADKVPNERSAKISAREKSGFGETPADV